MPDPLRARGRFAPSPTGDLHLGGARTALAAWLSARAAGGAFVLRMEDLDGPRVVPGAAARILEDLSRLGLDWDEGPDRGGPGTPAAFYTQSNGAARYAHALRLLDERGLVYPCFCSRADIQRAASAPNGAPGLADAGEGPRYPGTCRDLDTRERARRIADGRRRFALRFRVEDPRPVAFVDGVHGAVAEDPGGDFVLRRSDGLHAYQLAVVVDDAAMGITEVVRGDDLLPSTARQILLYRALGLDAPRFAHVPLVLGPDGERLAKRHGAIAVRALLDGGGAGAMPAEVLVGRLAASLLDHPDAARWAAEGVRPQDLLPAFSLSRVRRTPARLDLATAATVEATEKNRS